MHKELIINSTPNEVRVALLEDHEVVEFSMERSDSRRVVGNVYKGKVSSVKPGLQAAFVDLGLARLIDPELGLAGSAHLELLVAGPRGAERVGGTGVIASGYLRDHLKGPLRGAEVGQAERGVGRDHAHHADSRDIQSLCCHVDRDQDVDFAAIFSKFSQYF